MGTFQDVIADSKLRSRGLARGREGSEHERSIILINLRRELSTAGAKAQSACILGRVAHISVSEVTFVYKSSHLCTRHYASGPEALIAKLSVL